MTKCRLWRSSVMKNISALCALWTCSIRLATSSQEGTLAAEFMCSWTELVEPGACFTNDFATVFIKSTKISFCFHPCHTEVIVTKFCTWHGSFAAMVCAKFCSDMIAYNEITIKQFSLLMWIMMEKLLVKQAPGKPLTCRMLRSLINSLCTRT